MSTLKTMIEDRLIYAYHGQIEKPKSALQDMRLREQALGELTANQLLTLISDALEEAGVLK